MAIAEKNDRVIIMENSWENMVGLLLVVFENGNAEGRAQAKAELYRMAKAADVAVAMEKKGN